MKKRGPIITGIGAVMFGMSFIIAGSIADNYGLAGPVDVDMELILDDMFDEIIGRILVMPGSSEYVSYVVYADGVPLMWSIHIHDYAPGDALSVVVSDPAGIEHGQFTFAEEMRFGVMRSASAGVLTFEITNTGSEPVEITVMFSEDPANSAVFADSGSTLTRTFLSFVAVGVTFLVGLVILMAGLVTFLIDMRRHQQNMNRFDGWPDRY